MNWDVFRAYDIRGIYPDEIDEEAYYRIAKGLRLPLQTKDDGRRHGCTTLVPTVESESDSRLPGFRRGRRRHRQITTDMLYYAVGASSEYSGGVVVSASHNPKEYNGMKMVREKATAISSDTGLFDIRDAVKAGKDAEVTSTKKGTLTERDILDDYLEHVLKSIDPSIDQKVHVCRECQLRLRVPARSEARGTTRIES